MSDNSIDNPITAEDIQKVLEVLKNSGIFKYDVVFEMGENLEVKALNPYGDVMYTMSPKTVVAMVNGLSTTI